MNPQYQTPWKLEDLFTHPLYESILAVTGTQGLPDKIYTTTLFNGITTYKQLPAEECTKLIVVSEELHLMLIRYFQETTGDMLTSLDNGIALRELSNLIEHKLTHK